MKNKSLIQLFLAIVSLVSIYLVYSSFFKKNIYVQENKSSIVKSENDKINLENTVEEDIETEKNIISNLKYVSFDTMGNKYLINSKSAEVNAENEELIKLIDVTAVIYLKERSPIYIESDYAIHNKNVFDTKFYDNVNIRHDKIKISSGNLDLIYNSNLVSLYNITEIYDNNTQLIADKIDFDILTKNVSINMYKKNQKVKIIYK